MPGSRRPQPGSSWPSVARPASPMAAGPLVVLGWVVLAATAVPVGIRLSGWDTSPLPVVILALLPWLLFASWPVAAAAIVARRWALSAAALAVVAVHLCFVVPQFAPLAKMVPAASGADLRILDANVSWFNHDMVGIERQIRAGRPDLVALEEVTPDDVAQLQASGVLAPYSEHLLAPSPQSDGMAVWSTVPLGDATVWDDAGHPALRATLRVPGWPPARLLVVHPYIPISLPTAQWRAELHAVAAAARAAGGPLLVIGDFNATWDMPGFRAILAAGLRDAAVVAGRGWRMTFAPSPALPATLVVHR